MIQQPAPRSSIVGMTGHGFYDATSSPQLAAQMAALPWLVDALVEALREPITEGTLVFADFGCSEGRNSVFGMTDLVKAARKASDRPIQAVHSDLPTNDFNSLLGRLRAGENGPYPVEGVFPSAVAGSMFEQLLAPASVTAATTFNSVGYLSVPPAIGLSGFLLPNGPRRTTGAAFVTVEEHDVFFAQSQSDLASFYRARSAELIPGGLLLVKCWGRDESTCTSFGVFDVLHDALRSQVEGGGLTDDQLRSFVDPAWFCSIEDLLAPLADPSSPEHGTFRILRSSAAKTPMAFVDELDRTGDVATYATSYAAYLQAFAEPLVRLHFGELDNIDELVDGIFDEVKNRVADDLDYYRPEFLSVAALLQRI